MTTNLDTASREWATRPDDERFSNLADMAAKLRARRERCVEALVPSMALTVAPTTDGDLGVVGPTGQTARFTNYSFGQMCRRAAAPAEYLATLPADLAARNLNSGLQRRGADGGKDVNLLLMQPNGDPTYRLRSAMTEVYDRAWDDRLLDGLQDLQTKGWRVPPARPCRSGQAGSRPATADDVLDGERFDLSVNVGDTIAPAGLYAGDRDMFVFMVNERVRVQDGTPGGLSRGFFLINSEVGLRSVGLVTFLYRHVCGNHIVWDARDVNNVRLPHVGQNVEGRALRMIPAAVDRHLNLAASIDEERIRRAQRHELGKDQKDVVRAARIKTDLSARVLDAAYERSEQDGENPRSAWGLAQGVTRLSQSQSFAGRRTELDVAAGELLRVAF